MDRQLIPTTVAAAEAAARRLASGRCAPCTRTPLIRCNFAPEDGPTVWLKLETLQPIGSFKIRGSGNAVGAVDDARLRKGGLVTASAGNMGQGVAHHAKHLGVPCTVVVPESAPSTKVGAIERLGGKIVRVPFDDWWKIIETGRCPQAAEGVFVHPVLDRLELAAAVHRGAPRTSWTVTLP
eukprot:TRINITY_DN11700_c0_g1_i2.p1 TRINITY_DN11700_c0_g1~~TRINITY_DN11700_c0_g1_i2.p1  ORF type:complete len:201 (+),score=41.81 TRINITY_DN11700_c0_g1_i2:62-604(+)